MSSSTPNIGLTLPTGGERVSRQIINENNTKIDTYAGELSEQIGNLETVSDLTSGVTKNDSKVSDLTIKVEKCGNSVHVRGFLVTNTSIAKNDTLFTLPSTAKPKYGLMYFLATREGNNTQIMLRIDNQTGSVIIDHMNGNTISNGEAFLFNTSYFA